MNHREVKKASEKNSLRLIENVTTFKNQNSLKGYLETDVQFLQNIFEIVEYSSTKERAICAKRAHLKEEDYQMIENIGKIHYHSNIYNDSSALEASELPQGKKCQCGCGRGNGNLLPFCINEEQENFFGSGVILFFFFVKRMISVLLLAILIYSAFGLISNIWNFNSEVNCESPGPFPHLCEWKIVTSLASKTNHPDLILIQLILGMIMCVVWVITLRCVQHIGEKKEKTIDNRLDSSSDLSIFISNLPPGQYSEKDVIDYLHQKWSKLEKKNPLKINSVQIIYRMEDVREKILKIQNTSKYIISSCLKERLFDIKDINEPLKIKKNMVRKYQSFKKTVIKNCEELKNLRSEFVKSQALRKKMSSECAVVHFADENQSCQFLNTFGTQKVTITKQLGLQIKNCLFNKYGQEQEFKGRKLRIIKSPEPSDINWQHCEHEQQTWRILIVWVLTLGLIGCTFGLIMLGIEIKKNFSFFVETPIIVIVVIFLAEKLVWVFFDMGISFEKNKTKTESIISAMNKVYFFQTFNLIIIPILLNIVMDNNLNGPDGLAGYPHDYQMLICFFMIFFNVVDVPHRLVMLLQHIKCLRRLVIRYLCRVTGQFDNVEEFRDALKFLYEPPSVPLVGFYTYSTSIISQAAFYCHLSPVILVYLLLNLIIFYLLNRYLILRVCKIPDLIDFLVFEQAIYFSFNFPLLYGIGSITFTALRGDALNFGFYLPSIICIILWFLTVHSPFNICRKMAAAFFPEKPALDQKPNTEIRIVSSALEEENDEYRIDHSKRKENYFANVGSEELFNFQNRLREVRGPYHDSYPEFCQRFHCEKDTRLLKT